MIASTLPRLSDCIRPVKEQVWFGLECPRCGSLLRMVSIERLWDTDADCVEYVNYRCEDCRRTYEQSGSQTIPQTLMIVNRLKIRLGRHGEQRFVWCSIKHRNAAAT